MAVKPDATRCATPTSRPSAKAGRKQRERLVDGEQRHGDEVFGGDPLKEGNLDRPVGARCRVQFVNGGKTLSGKPVSDTHESRPDPAVDQGDLSIDQTRRDDVGRVENAGEHGEDLVSGRVPHQLPRIGSPAMCSARFGSGPRADCNTTPCSHTQSSGSMNPIQTRGRRLTATLPPTVGRRPAPVRTTPGRPSGEVAVGRAKR
jgi:hypothetical protein